MAALLETGIYDTGVKKVGEYTFIYSGLPSTDKTRTAHGVAMCMNKESTHIWQESGAQWEAVNERILRIRIYCKPINITIIAIYAPVNPISKATKQVTDDFYHDLQQTYDKVLSNDIVLYIGNFNARVGLTEHNTSPQTVGPFASDSRTYNGEKLIEFCLTNNLVITNTFLQHKTVQQKSWMHPKTKK